MILMRNSAINDVANAVVASLSERINNPVIPVAESGGFVAGRSLSEAFALYKAIHNDGLIKKCHYCVEIEPYDRHGAMANSADIQLFKKPTEPFNHRWLLITQADWPILQADSESQKVASYQSNRITGRQAEPLNLTFLDNKLAEVLNSLKAIEGFIFNPDGTQNPPAEYAIVMTPYLFDSTNYKTRRYAKPFLVSLQSVQTNTSGDPDQLEISTTWLQLDAFMLRS
jgi:hypothetical protein